MATWSSTQFAPLPMLIPCGTCKQTLIKSADGSFVVNICGACHHALSNTIATQPLYAVNMNFDVNLIGYIRRDLCYPYLYRVLSETDRIGIFNNSGMILPNTSIKAKNKMELKSVLTHVGCGSGWGYTSQYISTCAVEYDAVCWAKKGLKYSNLPKYVVSIEVNSLKLNGVIFIDLKDEPTRKFACGLTDQPTPNEFNIKAYRYAGAYSEVLIVGDIPASCIKTCHRYSKIFINVLTNQYEIVQEILL